MSYNSTRQDERRHDDRRGYDDRRGFQDRGIPDERRHQDQFFLDHPRGLFEKEALEVTFEGRVALMTALAARIREVCAGLLNHPRVRDMSLEDKGSLVDAVTDAGNLAMSLTTFTGALLEQEPTREAREKAAREARPAPRAPVVSQPANGHGPR